MSPSVLMLVTIFQFMENLPDREAARAVRVRLDWKYALPLAVDDPGFDFSCLSYFRRRLLKHEQSRLLFDLVLEQVRGLGFCRRWGSSGPTRWGARGGAGAKPVEAGLGGAAAALRALGEVDAAWVAQAVPTAYRTQYLERRSDSRLTAEERQAELVRVGQDGAWLLDRLAATDAGVLRTLPEVETLTTIWQQRYERADDGVRWRSKTLDSTELIVTPHDPGVRIGQKRGHVWWGDKVHVTETIAEPPAADDAGPVDPADQVRFITDVTTSPAPSGDGQALAEIRAHLTEQDLLPTEQVVDSGYVSGKHLAESAAAEIDLVGPPLADTSPNGFKIADFTLDHAARQAICPARRPPNGRSAASATASRAPDPLPGRRLRRLPLGPSAPTARAAATSASPSTTPASPLAVPTRPRPPGAETRAGIEATLSELVRAHGLRRHRYRGDAKRHFEHLPQGRRLQRQASRPCPRYPPTRPLPPTAPHQTGRRTPLSRSRIPGPPCSPAPRLQRRLLPRPAPDINQQRHPGRFR
ncbi:MAG: transposase [Chloroflexota bacterium]